MALLPASTIYPIIGLYIFGRLIYSQNTRIFSVSELIDASIVRPTRCGPERKLCAGPSVRGELVRADLLISHRAE